MNPFTNSLLLKAVAVDVLALVALLGVPAFGATLGGTWPSALGWAMAGPAIPIVLATDTLYKVVARRMPQVSGANRPGR